MGELKLERNTQATARILGAAAVVGAGLMPAWMCAADQLFGWGMFDRNKGPYGMFVLLGAVLGPTLSYLLVWMRQPKGARLTWDDWGITEWDGEGVRAAIPKASLRAEMMLSQVAMNVHRRGGTHCGAGVVHP